MTTENKTIQHFEEWRSAQEPSQLRAETAWQTIERAFTDAYRKGAFFGAAEMQKLCDIDYDKVAAYDELMRDRAKL